MTVRNLPPDATPDAASAAGPCVRTRVFCFATFRFARAPRFELVYRTASLAPRRRRWLRIGVPGKISALLLGLGLDETPVANQNTPPLTARRAVTRHSQTAPAKSIQKPRGGLTAASMPERTAAQRPQYQREMEFRYDSYGGVFADWPDPGGPEQPV